MSDKNKTEGKAQGVEKQDQKKVSVVVLKPWTASQQVGQVVRIREQAVSALTGNCRLASEAEAEAGKAAATPGSNAGKAIAKENAALKAEITELKENGDAVLIAELETAKASIATLESEKAELTNQVTELTAAAEAAKTPK